MFMPTTRKEMENLSWDSLDVILISGDTYIDTSYSGIAVIGKYLISKGYKVGVIAQPDIHSDKDIKRLGEPNLFWGVSGGTVDSIVANFTASLKRRKLNDDFTPGTINDRRPDNAVIVYSNMIKQYFKNTKPIVLGGIEASLRRVAHYDYLKDRIKRSILFDAKADYIVYGMGEKSALGLAEALSRGDSREEIGEKVKGICYIGNEVPEGYDVLPSFEDVKTDKDKFTEMFKGFYKNSKSGLAQKQDTRYLIQNPGDTYTTEDLDYIYGLDYERDAHPYYLEQGEIRAVRTIKNSITTHRGCFGNCNFCAITAHQGKAIISRSEKSIIAEAIKISKQEDFNGVINDVGGPTANMYGMDEARNHKRLIELLKKLRAIEGVRKIYVGSGLRYDLVLKDKEYGRDYLRAMVDYHTSGQLKIAPEHMTDKVLKLMGKPPNKHLTVFKQEFDKLSEDKDQYLTYYFIAAHPGCSEEDERETLAFVEKELEIHPEQVQIFTPTPATYSTLMYYTEKNPFSGEKLYVEKNIGKKGHQKRILTGTEDIDPAQSTKPPADEDL